MTNCTPLVRDLGLADYVPVCEAMRLFTQTRTPKTPDEIWFVEHPCVYTAGRDAHTTAAVINGIPLIQVERGGDITLHAPGQMVVYPLLDLRRRKLMIKPYVSILLTTLIDTLADFGLCASTHPGAPGVYVPMDGGTGEFKGKAKIASIGIRVSRGCTFHGIALNVDTDLAGFRRIAPCGYRGLRVTDMASLGIHTDLQTVKLRYRFRLLEALQTAFEKQTK